MTSIGRLIASFEADVSKFDAGVRHVESRMKSTARSVASSQQTMTASVTGGQQRIATGELSLQRQLSAVVSLQRQRSAALLSSWKQQERAALSAAAGVRPFREVIQSLSTSMAALQGPLGSVAGRLSSVAAIAGGLTVTTGGVALSLAAATAGAIGAAFGIYKLTTNATQLGGEIFDLSQKVNFNAETLSSLKVAAELSGGSLESLSTSLGIFDRNLEESKDSTSEISKVFKALKIDITDNEQALRQAFKALSVMKDGSQQTALAMKLFGRSGKEVLGILKETGGDVDAFTEKTREMGLVITSSGAKRADAFGDSLTLLRGKLEAITRQIGTELVPTVEKAVSDISRWLKTNQGEIADTAKELAKIVSVLYDLNKVIMQNSPWIIEVKIVRKIIDVIGPREPGQATSLESGSLDIGSLNTPGALPKDLPVLAPFRKPAVPHFQFTTGADLVAREQQKALDALNVKEKKGGGGGGRSSARQDPGVQLLKQLEEQFRDLTPRTELQKVQEKLLGDEYAKTTDAIKKKLQITAMEIDQQRMILAITRDRRVAMKTEREELEQMVELVRQAGELSLPFFSRRRTMKDITSLDLFDLGGGSARVKDDPSTRRRSIADGATRPRIATVEIQVLRERMEEMRRETQELSVDIADIIQSGFDRGWKGALDSARQIFSQISRELLQSGILRLLDPSANAQSQAGGLIGFLSNKLLDVFGGGANKLPSFGGKEIKPDDTYTRGGTGTTRPRTVGPLDTISVAARSISTSIANQTRERNGTSANQTQDLKNQIQATGQQIVAGLTPAQQGFWGGLANAAIGGALSGLASGLMSGAGGRGEGGGKRPPNAPTGTSGGWGNEPGRPVLRQYHRAGGGPVYAGDSVVVGEKGKELFTPPGDGYIVPHHQIFNQSQMGGKTENHYHYNIQLPPAAKGSYQSPKSQRELADKLVAILQSSQR